MDINSPILSAFYTKAESFYLEAKAKTQISVNYLPLQLIKHSAIIIFSNDKLGEFLYYLDGAACQPEPCKVSVDENSLDSSKIKLIKSNRKPLFYVFNFDLIRKCEKNVKLLKKAKTPMHWYSVVLLVTESRPSC